MSIGIGSIKLSEVEIEVEGSVIPGKSLRNCFADATGNFDATYVGNKDRLSNFQNYANSHINLILNSVELTSDNSFDVNFLRDIQIADPSTFTYKYGICYNTTGSPTINDNLIEFSYSNNFKTFTTVNMKLVTPINKFIRRTQHYYFRTYIIYIQPYYSNEVSTVLSDVYDYDGNAYEAIRISDQIWLNSNLKTTHLSNGHELPGISTNNEWRWTDQIAYCDYNNGSNSAGKLYNQFSVYYENGFNNLVSYINGWHIPNDWEWWSLFDYVANTTDNQTAAQTAGGHLKGLNSNNIIKWNNPNTGAIDDFGFNGLPGGNRTENGDFIGQGVYGRFASSAPNASGGSNYDAIQLQYDSAQIQFVDIGYVHVGTSIRLLRDS